MLKLSILDILGAKIQIFQLFEGTKIVKTFFLFWKKNEYLEKMSFRKCLQQKKSQTDHEINFGSC